MGKFAGAGAGWLWRVGYGEYERWMNGWMDGWIDDSPTTPHRALGPARSMYQCTIRALDLPFLFRFFLPGSRTRSPQLPFFQSASFLAYVSPGSSCFFKPLFWIFGGPAARSFCLFSNTPSCTHSALAVDARLAREPGLWHLYRARLKHEMVDISRRWRA